MARGSKKKAKRLNFAREYASAKEVTSGKADTRGSPMRRRVMKQIAKAVASGKAVREVCRKVVTEKGASTGAVQLRFRRYKKNGGRLDKRQLLSDVQEEHLVLLTEAFAAVQMPLTRKQLCSYAATLLGRTGVWNSSGWFDKFKRRWSFRLTMRSVKGLGTERVDSELLGTVTEWCEWYESFLAIHNVSGRVVYNMDETRLVVTGKQHNTKVLVPVGQQKYSALEARGGRGATYVPIICAEGFRLIDVFIVPLADKGSATATITLKELRGDVPVFFIFNKSGWLNSECMDLILPKFIELHRQTQRGAVDPILLMDNLPAHRKPESCKWCVDNKVLCAFFPAHCSHFVQPLDDLPLAAFKKKLLALCAEKTSAAALTGQSLGDLLLEAAQEARGSITGPTIVSAFKRTGVWPFKKQLIKDRAKATINGPTPEDAEAQMTKATLVETIKAVHNITSNSEPSVKVHAPAVKNKLYSAEDIAAQQEAYVAEQMKKQEEVEARKAQAVVKKRATAFQKLMRAGRHPCCGAHDLAKSGDPLPCWDGEEDWEWCATCSEYGMCGECVEGGDDALTKHEADCAGKKPVKKMKKRGAPQ